MPHRVAAQLPLTASGGIATVGDQGARGRLGSGPRRGRIQLDPEPAPRSGSRLSMRSMARNSPEAQWRQAPSAARAGLPRGWLRLAADLHEGLLRRWVGSLAPGSLVLKTDLFEEALAEGAPFSRIRAFGWIAAGMDIGWQTAAQARRMLARQGEAQPRALVADARRIALRDESFDAVFSNSTLDHFATRRELDAGLNELGRVLRPGGRLLLTLDNPGNPVVWLRNALPRRLTDGLRITRYFVGKTYGLRRAQAKLRRMGFEILAGGAMLHAPRYVAIRLLRWAEAGGMEALESALVRGVKAMEALGRLPTARLTGHFIWIEARKARPAERMGE